MVARPGAPDEPAAPLWTTAPFDTEVVGPPRLAAVGSVVEALVAFLLPPQPAASQPHTSSAAERWRGLLEARAIPAEIRAAAPT